MLLLFVLCFLNCWKILLPPKQKQAKKQNFSVFFYVFLSSISSSMNRFSAMPGNDNDPDRKPW